MKELIVVKQLPIIEEQLKNFSEDIDKKVTDAKSLICTEENKQIVKDKRAELKKVFTDLEEKRKAVKNAVMNPYNEFEKVYKKYVAEKFIEADKELKIKIDTIENEQKKRLEDEAKEYFEEYKKSKNIEFIAFDKMNLKIGVSDNPTKLKKQIVAFMDKIEDELKLIGTQEHKAEILVEYKQSLNVSQAITTVNNRFKAIEEEKKRQEEIKQKQLEEAQKIADENIKMQAEATKQALDNFIMQKPVEVKKEEIFTLKFIVKGTKSQLRELKEFLINGGYEYE